MGHAPDNQSRPERINASGEPAEEEHLVASRDRNRTDDDYFESYTRSQRDWLESGRADELAAIVYDLEYAEEPL